MIPVRKSKTSTPAPEGTHFCRIIGVTDLGHQPGFEWSGGSADSAYKIELTYELVNTNMDESGQEKRPFLVSEEVKNTDSDKGTLYKRCSSVGIGSVSNVADLVGRPAMLTVEHNAKGYAKVKNLSGVPMGTTVEASTNPEFTFSPSNPEATVEEFLSFPNMRKNKITSALDFHETPLYMKLVEAGEVPREDM